jgi:hypothetical protein
VSIETEQKINELVPPLPPENAATTTEERAKTARRGVFGAFFLAFWNGMVHGPEMTKQGKKIREVEKYFGATECNRVRQSESTLFSLRARSEVK